jgi:hypothetical protein
MTANLGTLPVNVASLLETRLLVQANSGGGKSWCLRRLLEQTASSVQQIVIDPEGEFASLREKFDYIVCAPHDADAVATPQTAAALARALWESGTSAVVDIYDLKAHERTLFIRRFAEALVNAPKRIWHPTIVVIDEIHMFAPQVGQAESTGAVIDLATRGRKRGLALVGATQRLSKLHKDVAAELLNKLIGRTGLDVDVARAADELGMTKKDAWEALRNMTPGEFFAYGPALSPTIIRTRIGAVQTTHPKTGQRAMVAPPPPSDAVLKKLAKLEGIQREAQEEARTVEALQVEVRALHKRLQMRPVAEQSITEADVKRRELAAFAEGRKQANDGPATAALRRVIEIGSKALADAPAGTPVARTPRESTPAVQRITGSIEGLRKGAVQILAELAARAPAGYSRAQVGALSGFAHKGGTFQTYFGDLKRSGFIEERGALVYATDAGISALGVNRPATPRSHDEVMAMWRRALRAGAFAMLERVVTAGAAGVDRATLGADTGFTPTGGTFQTYLGDLKRNGLITEQGGVCKANDILFPERAA